MYTWHEGGGAESEHVHCKCLHACGKNEDACKVGLHTENMRKKESDVDVETKRDVIRLDKQRDRKS